MDSHSKRRQQAIEAARKAIEEDRHDNAPQTCQLYESAISLLSSVFSCTLHTGEPNPKVKSLLKKKIEEMRNRAEALKTATQTDEPLPGCTAVPTAIPVSFDDVVTLRKPDIRFSDVFGLGELKQILTETQIIRFEFPQLFEGHRMSEITLIAGPDGCGKAFLAEACAGEISAGYVSFSISDLYGSRDAEGILVSGFGVAHEQKPSLVCIEQCSPNCWCKSN